MALHPDRTVTMCHLEEASITGVVLIRFLVPLCRSTTMEVEIDACTVRVMSSGKQSRPEPFWFVTCVLWP